MAIPGNTSISVILCDYGKGFDPGQGEDVGELVVFQASEDLLISAGGFGDK